MRTREGRASRSIPEVMIPLVGTERELEDMKASSSKWPEQVMEEAGVRVEYQVGTMIEVPRACLVADKIAKEAEFFSFGTNDLTQMTFGYSRDDAGTFLGEYLDKGILEKDPFQSLDQEGVGQLVEIGVDRGRQARPDLKVGICGEHGGDPASVEVLPPHGTRLRQLLSLPRADRAVGGGPGQHRVAPVSEDHV